MLNFFQQVIASIGGHMLVVMSGADELAKFNLFNIVRFTL